VAGGIERMESVPGVAPSRSLADLLSLDEVGAKADLHNRRAAEKVQLGEAFTCVGPSARWGEAPAEP